MKVSIVTIVYNGAETLLRAMDSVLNQTYSDIEYILIDGGSTDGSLDLIKEKEGQIYYFCSEPDNGISDAFNKGLSHCTGDVIGILNSDDWYELDTVEKVVSIFQKESVDIVHGDMQFRGKDDNICRFTADHTKLKSEMTVNHLSIFIKKECYEKWGVFSEQYKYAMDYDLILRFYLSGAKFKYLPEVLVNMSNDGISAQKWSAAFYETYMIKKKNLGKRIVPALYFGYMIIRGSIARSLDQYGLGFLVRFYRKYFAKIKKQG
jgi:glycosyltransferase involved in cell wall biosynthesis